MCLVCEYVSVHYRSVYRCVYVYTFVMYACMHACSLRVCISYLFILSIYHIYYIYLENSIYVLCHIHPQTDAVT